MTIIPGGAQPTQSPALKPALEMISKELIKMRAQIAQLQRNQRAAQLAYTTVENGSITFNDDTGTPQIQVGLQPDGTHAVAAVNASDQQAPSDPEVAPALNGLYVTWDGTMSDGTLPLSDFLLLQVHVSSTPNFIPGPTTLQGVLNAAGTFSTGGLSPGTTYYVVTVAMNTAGVTGDLSNEIPGVPVSVPGSIPAGSITGGVGGLLAPLTVDITNLAAGLIVAGIVNGTLIEGANFVVYGTNGSVLVYNGLPEPGDLIMSISPVAGIDADGNAYIPGVITYTAGASPIIALGFQNGSQVFATATTEAGPYTYASGSLRSVGSLTSGWNSPVAQDINGVNDPPTVTQIDAHTIAMAGRMLTPSSGSVIGVTFATLAAPFVLPPSGGPVPEFPTANVAGGSSGSIVLRPNGNMQLQGNFGNGYTIITCGTFRF
jgi:hypothetical protein